MPLVLVEQRQLLPSRVGLSVAVTLGMLHVDQVPDLLLYEGDALLGGDSLLVAGPLYALEVLLQFGHEELLLGAGNVGVVERVDALLEDGRAGLLFFLVVGDVVREEEVEELAAEAAQLEGDLDVPDGQVHLVHLQQERRATGERVAQACRGRGREGKWNSIGSLLRYAALLYSTANKLSPHTLRLRPNIPNAQHFPIFRSSFRQKVGACIRESSPI